MKSDCDVLVMGAGPGGCATGILLARAGLKVTILEGEKHPRHHIGESLLPGSMRILRQLGISEADMIRQYQKKIGARFYDPETDRMADFGFAADDGGTIPAFQVLRESFDTMLFEKARTSGCLVMEASKITSVNELAQQPNITLSDGQKLTARFLVDATGRSALLARKHETLHMTKDYGRVAVYNYFANLPPHDDRDAEVITMYVFEGGWVWLIPLANGRTSVGVVYRSIPQIDAPPTATESKEEQLFWHAVRTMPRLEKRLTAACPTEPYRAISDYSYSVSEKHGDRFVLIGDAAGFLDPIFSSGVHLALSSAEKAAAGVIEKLQTGSDTALNQYAAFMDQGYRVFSAFVERFYNHGLVRNIFFMQNKPPAMHAAITAILAGDVWNWDNPALKYLGVKPPPIPPRH